LILIIEKNDKVLESNQIKYLIIHCSDTDNIDINNASHIHKMHIGFGWDGIGYHKIICKDGLIEDGRPEYWVGAHAYGYNHKSLGVCLIGKNEFTDDQFDSLFKLLKLWKSKYPNTRIIGHKDTATSKTCPNFDVLSWCKERNLN